MEQSEEMTMTKKQEWNKVKSILYGICGFIIVAMSLFQSPLDRYSIDQKEKTKKNTNQ